MNQCDGDTLKAMHFKEDFMRGHGEAEYDEQGSGGESLEAIRNRAERKAIVEALIRSRGNKVKAAAELSISRSLIHKKIRKFQIKEDEF